MVRNRRIKFQDTGPWLPHYVGKFTVSLKQPSLHHFSFSGDKKVSWHYQMYPML